MPTPYVVRWIPVVTLLAAFAVSLVPSSVTCAEEGTAPDALGPGSWSVQFSVQPNFTLGTYSGSTLSLKKHLGSGNALRMGLSTSVSHSNADEAGTAADTSTFSTRSSTFDRNNWNLGINALYLWYAHRAAPVYAYWGLGPSFSVTHGHNEGTSEQTTTPPGGPVSTYANEEKTNGWSAGIGGTLGVEWLVARRIGMFAEYGTSFAYSHFETRLESTLTSGLSGPVTNLVERTQDGWELSGSGGRLGISVYY